MGGTGNLRAGRKRGLRRWKEIEKVVEEEVDKVRGSQKVGKRKEC